jgi:hypothetical protein
MQLNSEHIPAAVLSYWACAQLVNFCSYGTEEKDNRARNAHQYLQLLSRYFYFLPAHGQTARTPIIKGVI